MSNTQLVHQNVKEREEYIKSIHNEGVLHVRTIIKEFASRSFKQNPLSQTQRMCLCCALFSLVIYTLSYSQHIILCIHNVQELTVYTGGFHTSCLKMPKEHLLRRFPNTFGFPCYL